MGTERNPKVIQELLRQANLKVTMDTYVQTVSDEKRKAQTKVVEMLLPRIRRAVNYNGLFWRRG